MREKIRTSYPYKMKVQDMTRYRKFQRSWGMWYAFDNATGNSVSLKTRVKAEAVQKVNAMNETERQPSINLGLARVYLNATDPKLATRTWQDVMENIITKKTEGTSNAGKLQSMTRISTAYVICISAKRDLNISTGRWPMAKFRRMCICAESIITRSAWNVAEIGHPAPAMAKDGVQRQAGNPGRRTRSNRPTGTKQRTPGLL
jgi:hypothetical protein